MSHALANEFRPSSYAKKVSAPLSRTRGRDCCATRHSSAGEDGEDLFKAALMAAVTLLFAARSGQSRTPKAIRPCLLRFAPLASLQQLWSPSSFKRSA